MERMSIVGRKTVTFFESERAGATQDVMAVPKSSTRNLEANRAKNARWRAAHRDEARARAEAWRQLNPERAKEMWQTFYKEHRPELLAQKRARYRDDPALREELLAKNRAWYVRNRDRRRAYERNRKYGLTPAQVDALFISQGGACKLCRIPAEPQRLVVDHDHRTGAVRGLLCFGCNHWLKSIEDRDFVERAKVYLTQPPG